MSGGITDDTERGRAATQHRSSTGEDRRKAAHAVAQHGTDVEEQAGEHAAVIGTRAGYDWHRKRRELACDDCLRGHRIATQRWRDRNNPHNANATLKLTTLLELINLVPEQLASRAAAILGEETVERVQTIRDLQQDGAADG